MDERSTRCFRHHPYAVLRVSGADRVAFLQNMTTAHLKRPQAPEAVRAAVVDQKGVLVDWGWLHAGADAHWLIGHADRQERLAAWLDRYVITEDVAIEAVDLAGRSVFVTGPSAAAALQVPEGASAGQGPMGPVWRVTGWNAEGWLAWTEDLQALVGALAAHGVDEGDAQLAEAWRVGAGVPVPGSEADDRTNPWELRLDAAIALDKGCYLGQEVVARLRTYDKVQRALVGLDLGAGTPTPPPGTPLYDASDASRERSLGRITSVGPEGSAALAVIRRAVATAGTVVGWDAGDGRTGQATVADRGAWLQA